MAVAMVLGTGMVLVAPVAEVIWMGSGKTMPYKLTNIGDDSGYGTGRGHGWGVLSILVDDPSDGDGEGYGWGGSAGEGDPTGKCGCAILQDDEIP